MAFDLSNISPFSLHIFEQYLSKEDQEDVVLALRDGPYRFIRCYTPITEYAKIGYVAVACDGDDAFTALLLHGESLKWADELTP